MSVDTAPDAVIDRFKAAFETFHGVATKHQITYERGWIVFRDAAGYPHERTRFADLERRAIRLERPA